MSKQGRNAAIKVDGLTELLRDMNNLPKATQREVRKGSFEVADKVAGGIRGWGGTAQAAPLLDAVRARNDRIPTLSVGGDARAGVSGGASRGELLGANFGTNGGNPQFPGRRKPDYYVYATIKHQSSEIVRTWLDNVARALATVDPANRGV
jgi:hypothetical protein